jgi:hypothetical protein
MVHWKAGFQLDEEAMKPEVVVRHNCQVSSSVSVAFSLKLIKRLQTGRWVTM